MADPEGNEFCIGAFRRTKDGKRALLDSLVRTRVPNTSL